MNDALFNSPASTPHSPLPTRHRHSIDAAASSATLVNMSSERNGARPMPVGIAQQRHYHRLSSDMDGILPGGLPARSPPKPNKNTQHVPCKFFLQGLCQAGQACPFSHDIESTVRPVPCKYFQKGGCKFGRKCALLHIAQDGTVLNRMTSYQSPQYMAGPPPPPLPGGYAHAPPPPGLLTQSLEQRPNGDAQHHYDTYPPTLHRNGYDIPQFDMSHASPSPKYGSPPQNDFTASSPPAHALSVLDAPLPASFDSSGVSWAARHGPLAASVPSKFGIDSPPPSLPRRPHLGGTAVRDLRTSAYGERGMDNMLASMGSSPPSGSDEPIRFEKRSLLSSSLRASRPIVSASLGTRLPTQSFEYSDDEDEQDIDRGEDLLGSLIHDIIPQDHIRRELRARPTEGSPANFLAAQRRTISSQGPLPEAKVGSPSRYSSMFTQRSSSHVGSPLRDSGFAVPTPSRFGSANGDTSPNVSSPPRQASMSMLTQELQRTKLDAARAQASTGPGAQQNTLPIRTLSNGSTGGHAARKSLDRGLSTNSVGQRIEEDPDLFDMDGLGASENNDATATSLSRDAPSFGPIGGQRLSK